MRKLLAVLTALVLCIAPAISLAESQIGNLAFDSALAALDAGQQVDVRIKLLIDPAMMDVEDESEAALITGVLEHATARFSLVMVEEKPIVLFAVAVDETDLVTGSVRGLEEGLAIETSLLPQKTLLVPYAVIEEQFKGTLTLNGESASMEELQKAGETVMNFALTAMMSVSGEGMTSETSQEATAATALRDASDSHTVTTVTPVFLKNLFLSLAKTYAADTAMQELVGQDAPDSAELISEIEALVPGSSPITIDAYNNGEDLVGVDVVLANPFNTDGSDPAVLITYDRLTEGTMVSHSVVGKTSVNDTDGIVFVYAEDKPDANTLITTSEFAMNDGVELMAFDLSITAKRDGNSETVDTVWELRGNNTASLVYDMQPSGLFNLAVPKSGDAMSATSSVKTEAQADGTFTSVGNTWIAMDGKNILGCQTAMSAKTYTPADVSGNAVIDLTAMGDSDAQILMQELSQRAQSALMQAVLLLPVELQQQIMGQ